MSPKWVSSCLIFGMKKHNILLRARGGACSNNSPVGNSLSPTFKKSYPQKGYDVERSSMGDSNHQANIFLYIFIHTYINIYAYLKSYKLSYMYCCNMHIAINPKYLAAWEKSHATLFCGPVFFATIPIWNRLKYPLIVVSQPPPPASIFSAIVLCWGPYVLTWHFLPFL